MTILVTGARGNIGGVVLDELLAAGADVRASSRDPKPGDLPAGVEVVRADLTRPEDFPDLLRGVTSVFLYVSDEAVDEFVAAARTAGVEHVVLLSSNSVVFPDAAANPVAARHQRVEAALRDSGIAWTFVRPGYLATNTLRWSSIRTERVLRTAFPDAAVKLVHERDPGEVAARALLDPSHRGKAYLVLGAGPLTTSEQVATIADAIGEPVRLDVVDVETYRAELRTQLPEMFVERLIALGGDVPQVPEALRHEAVPEVLGREPLPFAAWARDHADDFR